MSATITTIQKYTSGAGSGPYTDNFEAYSNGNLDGQGSWVNVANKGVQIATNGDKEVYVSNNGNDNRDCSRRNGTFSNNQYAEVVLATSIGSGGSYIGPCVRCSTNNYYGVEIGDDSDIILISYIAGVRNVLAYNTASSISVGDVIRLTVTGTTLRVTKNGTAVTGTNFNGNGEYTDSDLSSGAPGIAGRGYNYSTVAYADSFECTAAS